MSYRLTILGCGSSGGVPRIDNDWGACDPLDPRNRRLRCAALLERHGDDGVTRVLIDTGPDIREQLLAQNIAMLDGVLYTHAHADHVHGIDDLRVLAYNTKRRIPVWFDAPTRANIETRFRYCFSTPEDSIFFPILSANDIHPPAPVRIAGPGGIIEAVPIVLEHGQSSALGFRFERVVYSPDVSGIPDASRALLEDLDLWIVDALRHTPHPGHFTVKQALHWIETLKCRQAILTHLHIDLDYRTLQRELPANVEPAYDGMVVEFE